MTGGRFCDVPGAEAKTLSAYITDRGQVDCPSLFFMRAATNRVDRGADQRDDVFTGIAAKESR
jgi:hypothetical protein